MLFNHYCNVTSKYLVTMGNIGPNPLLALCTPLNLLDTMTASSAAIRMSILSISTAHFAHETAEAIGSAAHTPEWQKQKEQLEAMSTKFKKAALSNITLAGIPNDSSVHNSESTADVRVLTEQPIAFSLLARCYASAMSSVPTPHGRRTSSSRSA